MIVFSQGSGLLEVFFSGRATDETKGAEPRNSEAGLGFFGQKQLVPCFSIRRRRGDDESDVWLTTGLMGKENGWVGWTR